MLRNKIIKHSWFEQQKIILLFETLPAQCIRVTSFANSYISVVTTLGTLNLKHIYLIIEFYKENNARKL